MDRPQRLALLLAPEMVGRIDRVAEFIGLSREAFIEEALASELRRQEIDVLKGEISILEIQQELAQPGQSLDAALVAEGSDTTVQVQTCQLCLRAIKEPSRRYDGPIFCKECLDLARGGDFKVLAAE